MSRPLTIKGCTYQLNPERRGELLRRGPTDRDFKSYPVPRDITELQRAVDWFEREHNRLASEKFRACMRRLGLLSNNKNGGACETSA